MTDAAGTAVRLSYLDINDDEVEDTSTVAGPVAETRASTGFFTARTLRLSDGILVRQLAVNEAKGTEGYRRLDNEILAGLKLARQVGWADSAAREVSRLIGYSPDPATPFALLEPYRGEGIETADVVGLLSSDHQHLFMVSLFVGLRRLAEAGVVHCAISPATVRWDIDHAIITDFSMATLTGTLLATNRAQAWGQLNGLAGVMTEGVDVLAAGQLIYYVSTGRKLSGRADLDDEPELKRKLDGVFARDPADRPSASEMLSRLGARDPVVRPHDRDSVLTEGREEFGRRRLAKHPELAVSVPIHPPVPDSLGPNGRSDPTIPSGERSDGGYSSQRTKRQRWRKSFGSSAMLMLLLARLSLLARSDDRL